MQALKDVRILDMTHVQAGPTCSQLLAWMGADVIKFEPPQGDATRGQLRDVPGADSLYFTMLNCNKRSITVNMKTAEGRQVFTDLLKTCDIVMENFGPGVLDRLGFTWEKVHEIYRLGLKHGMQLAAISGVNGVFSDEDIERVRTLALAARKGRPAPRKRARWRLAPGAASGRG